MPQLAKPVTAYDISRTVLEISKRANVGHIGSALSVSGILAALYGGVLQGAGSRDGERDRFILSKGHAALALYAALHLRGWITDEELNTYCGDGTLLGVHPDSELVGVDFTTGSLGYGLSMGAGAALAARLQGSSRRAFVVVSDAECNEGSLWEAVMFAAHNRLANLIAIVDVNGQQAFGYTHDVLSLAPLGEKWGAFGWDVHEIDGHDVAKLKQTIDRLDTVNGSPHVLVASTVFGHGVSYMERQIRWHYLPMSDAEYELALSEILSIE